MSREDWLFGEFPEIKVIVFDLDGTLYEDTHHFDFYARSLQEKLADDLKHDFWRDYQAAREGLYPLKIGTVYDVERDLILEHEERIVRTACRWDGQALSSLEIDRLYRDPITIDQILLMSVGDLWWLPAAIARHYRATGDDGREAFLETRRYMMKPEFVMKKIAGLEEALFVYQKAGLKLAMLTNSPENDSEVILKKLGLASLFDLKIFDGQKPTLAVERFTEIKEHFQVEFSDILSIGDNWINEILPAKHLGCRTILIDPHRIGKNGSADKIVRSISDIW